MNSSVTVVSSLDALEKLLNDFRSTLEYERSALIAPDADQVSALVVKKTNILQKINNIHPDLAKRIADPVKTDAQFSLLITIKHLIERCKEYNKENGTLVAQNLKITKNTINLLGQGSYQPALELYDVYGQTAMTPGKRDHGVA